MKAIYKTFLVLITSVILSSSVFASEPVSTKSILSVATIENNLMNGLSSDNLGLRLSSAYYLGEYKSEKAVLPLIKMLHSEKEESARIQAALSLVKIGNAKGIFMVKQAAKFDDSQRVRNLCNKFYRASQKI
ncbi:MAG: HEAT repeat domain-containing protein [Ignavibacteriales bacterium]|nr:MAG: HEAT repeat domain-containing protein [Ignavibacteriales bacterium]